MAQNYKPKSASSASSKSKYQPKRIHARSSNLVQTTTPRVLDSSRVSTPEDEGKPSGKAGARREAATSSAKTRGGRRSTSSQTKKAATQKQSAKPKLFIGLGICAVIVAGVVALYFSSVFSITRIEVSGADKLDSQYIINLAEVSEDSTFLRTDVGGIKERLLTEPWIQSAEVDRVFPSTLVLRITEQPIAAVVDIVPETANDVVQKWTISADGTWMSEVNSASSEGVQISEEEYVGIPKIKDVSAAVRPEPGKKVSDEGIINALTLLAGFSPEMRSMVATISAPDAVKTTLTLYNNVGVAFGVAEDIKEKERAIATLLAEYEGTITYINVRVADRATHRATGQ